MTFTSRRVAWCWAALLTGGAVLGAAGCNKAPEEKLARVTGKVTVAGQPLRTGSITFRPDPARGNKSQHQPTSAIGAEGNYDLSVPVDRKGAPPGWYRVVVTAYDNPRPGNLKSLISTKYQDAKTTPLEKEVVENPEPGRYDFNLTR